MLRLDVRCSEAPPATDRRIVAPLSAQAEGDVVADRPGPFTRRRRRQESLVSGSANGTLLAHRVGSTARAADGGATCRHGEGGGGEGACQTDHSAGAS